MPPDPHRWQRFGHLVTRLHTQVQRFEMLSKRTQQLCYEQIGGLTPGLKSWGQAAASCLI